MKDTRVVYEVYDPCSSEVLKRCTTLAEAVRYVEEQDSAEGRNPPQWGENVPGEWWAMYEGRSDARYVIFTETV